jgi:hypothetical protein
LIQCQPKYNHITTSKSKSKMDQNVDHQSDTDESYPEKMEDPRELIDPKIALLNGFVN